MTSSTEHLEALLDEPGLQKLSTKSLSRKSAGWLFLLLVVISWIGQSEVAQLIEAGTSYDRPYFLTYINHSICILLLPGQSILLRAWKSDSQPIAEARSSHPWWRAALLATVYQLADWTWYMGLASTSVADGTIIFNSMSVFVFLLEWLLQRQRISAWKGVSVLVCLLGIMVVQVHPGANNDTTSAASGGCFSQAVGNMLVLLAAFLYAVFQIGVDVVTEGMPITTVNAFTGFIGIMNSILLWPGMVILNNSSRTLPCVSETFSWPSYVQIQAILVNGGLALVFNASFCMSIVTAGPLVTSAGCMLTVPGALLTDFVLHGDPIELPAILGSCLVVAGFWLLTFTPMPSSQDDTV